jgi:hypothetical protein
MEHAFGSRRNKKKRCNSPNWMNGEKKHNTIPRSTRREPKDGMIRG